MSGDEVMTDNLMWSRRNFFGETKSGQRNGGRNSFTNLFSNHFNAFLQKGRDRMIVVECNVLINSFLRNGIY